MSTVAYQCPSCGGELKYSPAGHNFTCEYCLSEFTEAEIQGQAAPLSQEEVPETQESTAAIYICPNCGAEVITDSATTAATECYFCHSPVVLSGQLEGKYLPKKIIPFALDKAVAVDKFKAWCRTKKYLPRDFFSPKSIQHMQGIYFPYWIIDADTQVDYTVEGEQTTTWTVGEYINTRHRVFHCKRSGDVHLEDVVKAALKNTNKTLVENVQPFDEAGMKPFTMAYLSGFSAQRRDIEVEAIQDEVHRDIQYYSKQVVAPTVSGYSSMRELAFDCWETLVDWEYGLLPVWILTYSYQNATYYFAMNGQTGKTTGKLPVDKTKLFWHALGMGILGAIGGAILGGLFL